LLTQSFVKQDLGRSIFHNFYMAYTLETTKMMGYSELLEKMVGAWTWCMGFGARLVVAVSGSCCCSGVALLVRLVSLLMID
jgi:hypothetical protein